MIVQFGIHLMMKLTRNKVLEKLGTKPTNPRWSWCAISPDHRHAIFTLWKDQMTDGRSQLLSEGLTKRRGGADQKKVLEFVIAEKIPAFGLVCVAWDKHADPRSIKEIEGEYLIRLKIATDGHGNYFGRHCGRVHMLQLIPETRKSSPSANDGLRDLESTPSGNEFPDRASKSSVVVIRDAKVRSHVLKQAEGKCECCGKLGFLMSNGRHYLEAHHIITLADQGPDTVENVIALYPEHHRQAHYGKDAEALEMKFKECIASRQLKNATTKRSSQRRFASVT